MHTKQFKLTSGLLKELAESGKGSAMFATLGVIDSDGDVTLPGAFGSQDAFLVPAHTWGGPLPPIGKGMSREEGDKAVVDFKLNLDTQGGKEWRSHLKFDLENGEPKQEWSYGFDIVESEMGEMDGRDVQFLKQIRIHEFSPVILGAGIGTGTMTMKSGQTLTSQFESVGTSLAEAAELLKRCRSLAERRAKEGRNLSEANRTKLAILLKNLDDIKEGIDELLKDTSPTNDNELVQSLLAQYNSVLSRFATEIQ